MVVRRKLLGYTTQFLHNLHSYYHPDYLHQYRVNIGKNTLGERAVNSGSKGVVIRRVLSNNVCVILVPRRTQPYVAAWYLRAYLSPSEKSYSTHDIARQLSDIYAS